MDNGIEAQPGVYEIRGNGAFGVEALRGLINTGTRDCTAHIYRHQDGHAGGARGAQMCEMTIFCGGPGYPAPVRDALRYWVPPNEPLIVEVADFVGPSTPGDAGTMLDRALEERRAMREIERDLLGQ